MELEGAKQKYIETWGSLATHWGTNRTMVQIHALLLVSPRALSTEDVMNELKISRGNANMNLRALMDWGVVKKELVPGERKEFFRAEKDILEMFKLIVKERKKRELESIISTIGELKEIKDTSEEGKEFKKVMKDIYKVTKKSNEIMDVILKMENNWFFDKMIKLLK